MVPGIRRHFLHFDWITFLLAATLSSIGLMFVYSATYSPEIPYSVFFKKQAFGIATGLIIYLICCFIDYRSLLRLGYLGYFGVVILLIYTILKGHIGMGAQRWIDLVFFKLQPSELAKLLFPAFIMYYLYAKKEELSFSFKEFIPILLVLGASVLLIIKQPDLGTALILLFSSIMTLWLSGIPSKFFLFSFIFLGLSAPLSWHFLKEYQKKRIAVFLGYGDTKKERYQTEQAKIAIGSGGLQGKGFLQGTQNKFLFLPESRTDFIFAVLCEEWGFLGALAIILLWAMLILRIFYCILSIKAPFLQLLALSIVMHIILSTIINIAMVVGLLPIVGIPLPLISYGLSNLWVTFASLGWFGSIAMRRFYIRQ